MSKEQLKTTVNSLDIELGNGGNYLNLKREPDEIVIVGAIYIPHERVGDFMLAFEDALSKVRQDP